jgi:hypothetical protein
MNMDSSGGAARQLTAASVLETQDGDGGAGWAILRNQVPTQAIDAALRRIHLDVLCNGLPSETMGLWIRSLHWFPHLKWEPEITALADHLPDFVGECEMCDPQILLQLPDIDEEVELVSHVDRAPDWAGTRDYECIAGVALGPSRQSNGGLVVWPLDGSDPVPVDLDTGDVLLMDPKLPHASGLNREGIIRYAAYFRFLQN